METKNMDIKLFGALRKYGTDAVVKLQVPSALPLSELKSKLDARLKSLHPETYDSAILDECAFATEEKILQPNEMVPNVSFLAVLPPVCGG